MRRLLREFVYRLRGEYTTEKLTSMGMKVGKNFKRLNGVILDPSHCWLIEIGDNVTMAPRVQIFTRPLSIKTFVVKPTLVYIIIPLGTASFKHIPKFLLKKAVDTNLYFIYRHSLNFAQL